MLKDLEPDEYATLLQMGSVDLDWSDPFTYPKGPKDNSRYTHKHDDKSPRAELTSLGKRPADRLRKAQRDPVQRDCSQTSGLRSLGSDAGSKVRYRSLSAGAICGVSAVQERKERSPEVQPNLETAATRTLNLDGATKTRAWSYSVDQRKWVAFE